MKMQIGLLVVMLVAGVGFILYSGQISSVKVVCQTTKGEINIEIEPSWSPRGAERFLQLVDDGFYQHIPLFRCVDRFICQFGEVPSKETKQNLNPYPNILDDPKQTALRNFKPGFLSFAGSGPNSRSTHVFITLGEKVEALGSMPWETPFGYVTPESMGQTVNRWMTSYGDMAPWGAGPDPQKIAGADGEEYLRKNFPLLDWINSCSRR